jgi:hypothetical protein
MLLWNAMQALLLRTVLFRPTVRNFSFVFFCEICPRSPGFLTKPKTFLAVRDA